MKRFVTTACVPALVALAGCWGPESRLGDTSLREPRGKDIVKWASSPTTRPRSGQSVPTRVCFVGKVVELDKKDGSADSRIVIRVERWVVGGPAGGDLGKDPVAVLFKLDEWRERLPSSGERWVIGCWMTSATDVPVFVIDTACAQYPAVPVDAVVN
jgi:hypothetical protein